MAEYEKLFLDSFNQFSGQLYQKTVKISEGNIVISPISIQTALSFSKFGASNETESSLNKSLKYEDISRHDLKKSFRKLIKSYKKFIGLSIANKIYLMKNCPVNPKFKKLSKKHFKSEYESIDFVSNEEATKNINSWVESKTNLKMKNFVSADKFNEDTRLVLLSAIYFKVKFMVPFDVNESYIDTFFLNETDAVEVEYMTITDEFEYGIFRDLDATVIQIPMKNFNVSMMFILPNSTTELSTIEQKLCEIDFNELSEKLHTDNIDVTLPKFKIEFAVDLKEPLEKMGMEILFSNIAEFHNFMDSSETRKVSHMTHRTLIEINEEGIEAAAVTGEILHTSTPLKNSSKRVSSSRKKSSHEFHVNKPFMFVLMQDSKPIFIGRKLQ